MTARFLVGDVHDRLAELADRSVDLLLTSPPFLALRSYLPDGHPDKDKEIGSEPTPAAYIDVLLQLTAEWGWVLAPHGSIAIELGDTYAGSGGAGGDYNPDGLREGQPTWTSPGSRAAISPSGCAETGTVEPGSDHQQTNHDAPIAAASHSNRTADESRRGVDGRNRGNTSRGTSSGNDWPLAKSLACIPQLYQVALAYGINPLTGQPSPAGRWRVRTLKPWIRSNPPVGALGDKERPATSYVVVACRASDRWFDLDAVRTNSAKGYTAIVDGGRYGPSAAKGANEARGDKGAGDFGCDPGGAPPRDWWHHVDAVLDHELALRNGKRQTGGLGNDKNAASAYPGGGGDVGTGHNHRGDESTGAQGVHLRRALERAGILTTLEALDVSPRGYSGAHYAVWPPELVRLLIDEMCPRRVCTTCGQPSRRLIKYGRATKHITTLGWSDCGHGTWRHGHVLDPFAGSGTTLAVATGMGRDCTGIDIDEANVVLVEGRVGMFLHVDWGTREASA